MSLLSYVDLCQLRDDRVLLNEDGTLIDPELINSASIDILLGDSVMVEAQPYQSGYEVALGDRMPLLMSKVYIGDGYCLKPGEFILAQSAQRFHLPSHISAEYKLKSSMARIGLEHLTAGWCDAGWHGSVLTLELKNMTRYHSIRIRPGDKIGQMVFFSHAPVPYDRSYAARGRYNNDVEATGVKQHYPVSVRD